MDLSAEPMDQTVSAACPICGSRHCQLQATARKAGVVVGGALGAIIAAGLSGATVGAANGAALVSVVSRRLPVTITGTIGGAIAGFAWGAIAGHAVGADIDENVLRIYQCRACGFEF
jgi:uncharacterized protein YcfJ